MLQKIKVQADYRENHQVFLIYWKVGEWILN